VRLFAILQVVVGTAYVIALGVLLPELWSDPLGALVKPLPLIVAALVVAAMAEDR
jgi:DoxX-like family